MSSPINLFGLRKITGNQDGILGRYEGTGNIQIVVGSGVEEQRVEIKAVLTINNDRTWALNFTINNNGDIETSSATGSWYENKLVGFGGSYYIPFLGIAFPLIYTKVTCPLLTTLSSK